jgi:hypothetical protein
LNGRTDRPAPLTPVRANANDLIFFDVISIAEGCAAHGLDPAQRAVQVTADIG